MKETGSLHHLMVYNWHGKPKEKSRGSSKRNPKESKKRNMTITRVAFGNSGAGHLQYYLPTGFVACGPVSVVRNMYILTLDPQQFVEFVLHKSERKKEFVFHLIHLLQMNAKVL